MNKKLVIFSFGFFLVFSMFGFVLGAECTDSDRGEELYNEGIKIFEKGEVCVGLECIGDYCLDEKNLVESICNVKGEFEEHIVSCQNGCSEGVCIKSGTFCVDSDGGKDYFVKGVGWQYYKNGLDVSSAEDECWFYGEGFNSLEAKFIEEQYCYEEHGETYIGREVYECPKGYGCNDGACEEGYFTKPNASQCLKEGYKCEGPKRGCGHYEQKDVDCGDSKYICCEELPYCGDGFCEFNSSIYIEDIVRCPEDCGCVDSDGGVEIYTKGTAESEGESITDVCSVLDGKDVVVEAVCESTGAKTIQLYCLNGCEDGACIEIAEQEVITESSDEEEVIEEVEEIGEPLLLEDCWDVNRNGVVDSIEDRNFDGEINIFDCLVIYRDREGIKEKFNEYLEQISGTTAFLIGGADIELRVENTEEKLLLYDIKISKGNITDFEKGGNLENPNYIIKIKENIVEEILLSGNPKTRIGDAYRNEELIIEPQTFGAKIKYFFIDKLNLVGNVISKLY